MATSKETASPAPVDALIHARWLLPMRRRGEILEHHSLAIEGQRIVAVCPREEAAGRFRAEREFELGDHLLLPGLINAHGHSAMTLFRGYADDMPLHPWLQEKIWPAEGRWVSEAFVYDGARLAVGEMLLGGITCFSDMYFFPDEVARAAVEGRIRAQLAAPVLDFPTVYARDADEYIHKATNLHDEFRSNDLITTAFGPHAAYTVSDAPMRKLSMLAEELDTPIHIHLHENAVEIEEAVKAGGLRPLLRLNELGLLSPRLQAVHMTQLTERELDLVEANQVNVVHCPSSNLKLASGSCPVSQLLAREVNVCLGTDGAASNNNLDMLEEVHLSALLGKHVADDAAAVSAWQALEMATINGARALGMEALTGSLEAGKLADLVAFDLNRLNTRPVYDPVSTLVYSANASQASHVWVNGHLNVENGRLLSLDPEVLARVAEDWGEKIQQDRA